MLLNVLLGHDGNIQWTSTISLVLISGNDIDSQVVLPYFSAHLPPLRAHLAKCVLLI